MVCRNVRGLPSVRRDGQEDCAFVSRNTSHDPSFRALRGRIGAYSLHARSDPRETTRNARATFLATFLDAVDPDLRLPEEERLRRAESARKAHFARMALASARARAMKKQRTSTRTGGA
jgi:hypothetical protein